MYVGLNCESEGRGDVDVFPVFDVIERKNFYGEKSSVPTKLCFKGSRVATERGTLVALCSKREVRYSIGVSSFFVCSVLKVMADPSLHNVVCASPLSELQKNYVIHLCHITPETEQTTGYYYRFPGYEHIIDSVYCTQSVQLISQFPPPPCSNFFP